VICESCGGVVGRDCFNPYECGQITRAMDREAAINPMISKLQELENALRPVKQEIMGRHPDVRHPTYNSEAHMDITLTVAECLRVLDALK
jgi:hypothetical protein